MNQSTKHRRYFATPKGQATRRRGILAQTVKRRTAQLHLLKEQLR